MPDTVTAFTNAPSCFANNDTTGNISRVTTVSGVLAIK